MQLNVNIVLNKFKNCKMVKKIFYSIIGSTCSIIAIAGIIISNAFSLILLFVIAAISGLFTLALSDNIN